MKRPFQTPRLISGGNIKMDFENTGSEALNWIHLAQNRDQAHLILHAKLVLSFVTKCGAHVRSSQCYLTPLAKLA
jgi:hypothetical protein